MGLSSKQVSSDRGIDWSQTLLQAQNLELPKSPQVIIKRQQGQNQHQSEPLKCPRCDSTNTKFCYYNNYNKSQPRHFCKACKRHWTKGGTLRNVPVGGGRKNKRLKTSKSSTAHPKNTATSTSTASISKVLNINRANDHPRMAIQTSKQKLNLPLSLGHDQKRISAAAAMHQELIRPPSSALQQNSIISSFNLNDVFFMGSPLSLPLNQGLHFPYPNSSSVPDLTPPSVSAPFQASTDYNYSRQAAMDDSTIPTIMHNSTSTAAQPWQVSNISSSSGFDMASCWNWDDMDNFASADLNIPWDDSEINP